MIHFLQSLSCIATLIILRHKDNIQRIKEKSHPLGKNITHQQPKTRASALVFFMSYIFILEQIRIIRRQPSPSVFP